MFYIMYICISYMYCCDVCFFVFKQKTAYEMRISDWSSDVCSSDLDPFTRSQLPRKLHCAGNVDARGKAKAQSLLRQKIAHLFQPFLIGNAELGVDGRTLQIGGDAALPAPFGDRRAFGLQLAMRIIIVARRRSEANTSDLQSLIRISYAVFRFK